MTFYEWIKPILSIFKFTPRHQAIFAITSLIIFLVPKDIVKDITPTAMYDYYRPIAAFIFILSISGLFVDFIIVTGKVVRKQYRIQKGKSRLNFLTKEEKNILVKYIGGESRTQNISILDGAAAELESLNILICHTDIVHPVQGVAFGITDWAIKYLKKNPHLLK